MTREGIGIVLNVFIHSFFDPAYDLTDGDDPSVLEWREEQRYEDGYYDTYDGSGLNDE